MFGKCLTNLACRDLREVRCSAMQFEQACSTIVVDRVTREIEGVCRACLIAQTSTRHHSCRSSYSSMLLLVWWCRADAPYRAALQHQSTAGCKVPSSVLDPRVTVVQDTLSIDFPLLT